MDLEGYLTVTQAAEELGVTRWAVYQAIRQGRLPSVEVLGRPAVHRNDVAAYKERTALIGPQGGRPRKPSKKRGRPRKVSKDSQETGGAGQLSLHRKH